jgi:hypothetical protein
MPVNWGRRDRTRCDYAHTVETIRDRSLSPTNDMWHHISQACADARSDIATADIADGSLSANQGTAPSAVQTSTWVYDGRHR